VQVWEIVKIGSLGVSQGVCLIVARHWLKLGGQVASDPISQDKEAPDYALCGYDGTRLTFRGPGCDLSQPYVATLGGSETFGRFVEHPFPELMQHWLGLPVANLGVNQAGLSLFSEERWLLDAASKAEVTVFQILGAQNMSNRLYSVHSRRNDRFLAVSPALRDIFPDVDFSEINFTGHLLSTLADRSRPAFEVLVEELKWAWVQRMQRIIKTIQGEVVLLWMSDFAPDDPARPSEGQDPAFVDRSMLDRLQPLVAGYVEIVAPDASPEAKMEGKRFPEQEREAALAYPGAREHVAAAEKLAETVAGILAAPGPRHTQARA